MAIVTPYPVGTVTDPFADCDTGCTPDPTNPYSLGAGWSYDAAWSPITNEFNLGDLGLSWMVVYNGKFYFLAGSSNNLYECNPSTGAVVSVAAGLGSGGYDLWSIETGALAGLYSLRRDTYNTHALCKWNEVDAWVINTYDYYAMYSVNTYNDLLYLGALQTSIRQGTLITWNGTTFTVVKDSVGLPVQSYTPFYTFIKNGLLYAVCIQISSIEPNFRDLVVATWDFTSSSWLVISDVLTDSDYQLDQVYAIWHNDTIYFGCRDGNYPTRKLNTNGTWTDLSGLFPCYSMISHADGRLYILSGVSDLYYYGADDSGPTLLVDNALHVNLDWRMVQYNNDLYCLYDIGYVNTPVYLHYVGKFSITSSGCAIADPYDYESLCTDPAYTT